MSVDSIGNFLTIIRNGVKVSNPYVIAPLTKINKSIAQILESEGFIRGFDQVEQEGFKKLKIFLKYVNGESAIHELDRVSKLSRRSYAGLGDVKPVIGGLGISILTT